MRDAGRRPTGRLCCWVLMVMAAFGCGLPASGEPNPQNGPATTTVTDTVYRADGSAAQGNLIISWPAFLTADGAQVAAGSTTAAIAANGRFSVELAPNTGATPAGVYYVVVYQIGPGQVKTEYWVVPATSPANLATVRTTVVGAGTAGPPVSMQYVNSELATKANDNAVVHLAGTETISGAKTFSAAPSVPSPSSSGQVANKAYVDSAVTNVGAGVYLPTAGGTMTGPITLPGSPAAPLQATTKQYVDTGLAAKADVVAGLVPANELGTGQASTGNCLQGNGSSATWGACGGGGGTGNLSTTPTADQNIVQPAGTQFSANNLANIRYVTANWNWTQAPADDLGTAGNHTIHLSPCPAGLDTASSVNSYLYRVYISGTGTPEAVTVTGGTCPAEASAGTITVTTAYSHAAGYTVGSASTGIQEAWNDAWVNDQGGAPNANSQAAPYVKLVADTQYNVYATVYLRGRGGVLDGAGALIACSTRDRCLYVGTSNGAVNYHKLYNLSGTSTVNVDGVQVASVSAASGTYTITTAANHPFVAGDTVDCEYYSQTVSQHFVSPVVAAGLNATQFEVQFGTQTLAAGANTFGFCNILNAFLENNSDHVTLQDLNLFQAYPNAGTGYFSHGVVNDNDQQFIIERAANRGSRVVKNSANWPLGAFIYQRTDQGNAGIVYLHNSEISNINCVTGGGNGMVISDTVCQGFPVFGIRYFGGLQPITIQNVYQETSVAVYNPLYSGNMASAMGNLVQGGLGSKILGTFPLMGWEPVFASGGSSQRNYWVVPHSSTQGVGPMLFIGSAQPASGSVSIPLQWPSVELRMWGGSSLGMVTWDVLVTTGVSGGAPYGTGNYAVATNIADNCGTNGMCTFTDTQAAPSVYTVASVQQFAPVLWFWPATIALNSTSVYADYLASNSFIIPSQGAKELAAVAATCKSNNPSYEYTPAWVQCLSGDGHAAPGVYSTLFQQTDGVGNGPAANSKGRLNLSQAIAAPNDLITLADSNIMKTLSTAGNRPANDAGDMAIGVDQNGGLALRAASSVSSYINTQPAGGNWLERLTGSAKSFQVPVTTTGGITGASIGPYAGTASPLCIVDGTNNRTIADCESYLGGLGFSSSGTIWSFVPEDFTSDPFVNFHGTIILGHQTGAGDTCTVTAPYNCYLTEVPLTLPTHLTVQGQQNPGRSQGPFNAGTVISFGTSYPQPLGVPANAANWTGTGNHTPDFSCLPTGGSLGNGTYYIQVWEALDRTGGTGGANKTPGYSAPTTEAAVNCANGTSTQSITFHAPTASGSGNFVAQDFFAGTAMAAAVNGAGQEQSNTVGTQWTCPGAAGSLDTTFGCAITAGVATIKAVPAVATGNPPPLVDLSTCFITFGTGVPGVTPNSFGVQLKHLTLSGLGNGNNGNNMVPVANEPSCALLGWTAQEQSGPDDVTFTGPWINTAFYSGYKGGNSYAKGLHMPSNEGPGQTGQIFYPLIVDGRGLGNGGIRTLEDSTIAMRCNQCSQTPTTPYSVWMTGDAVALHAHGIHLENGGGGDGFFVDNLAGLDLSGVTGSADTNHFLVHLTATADVSCVSETKVGKNGGVKDDATGFSNSGFNVNGFRYCNQEAAGSLTAASGTFSGNLTVNGQLLVAGPWMVSSPIPGTAMAAAGAGTSALGISNDGNFYISANGGTPQKVATSGTSSYFSNLFQEDGNDVGMYNGTNAQNLHVYSSYTNSSTWQRTSVGYDGASGYAVLRSEVAPSGSAPGIGFWVNSGLKWVIDPTSTLKPWANNSFNVGSATQAPATVYAATAFDSLTQGRLTFELCNDATTGTALNFLAKYNGASPACAVKAGTADTDGLLGIVSGGSGTSGNAVITYQGYASCSFDGSTTAGDFVVASTTNAGDCHDAGATRPAGLQALGRVESSNAGTGTYGVRVAVDAPLGAGSGGVPSVFGRVGAVTAEAGDYSCAQVTNCPAASATTPNMDGTAATGSSTAYALADHVHPTDTSRAPAASPTFTGIITVPQGSTAQPFLTAAGYPYNGLYFGGAQANYIGFADYISGHQTCGGLDDQGQRLLWTCAIRWAKDTSWTWGNGGITTANTGDYTLALCGTGACNSNDHGGNLLLTNLHSYGTVTFADGSTFGASGLSLGSAPTLPGATAATTQSAHDNSTKLATTAYVDGTGCTNWMTRENGSGTYSFQTTSNKASIQGVVLNCPLTTSQVLYDVLTADNTANTYDIGIYDSTGTLRAHTGATAGTTFAPSTGFKTLNWTGGPVYLLPGKYYLATTTNCTSSCATMGAGNSASGFTFYNNTSVSIGAGGTLSNISAPSDTPSVAATIPAWWVH